ncbi:hypothetical protein PMI18_04696, partial [Pseudomonas sp. GM102]
MVECCDKAIHSCRTILNQTIRTPFSNAILDQTIRTPFSNAILDQTIRTPF